MTKSERREVAATLREWAEWCEANPKELWVASPYSRGIEAALHFCQKIGNDGNVYAVSHRGSTAALALCFAAAMVESGDDL